MDRPPTPPHLSDSDLREFLDLLDWSCGYPLPDGRYLGWTSAEPQAGRAQFPPGLDYRVQALVDHLSPRGKTILEPGSCEGVLTVQLAPLCERVVAVEVRPKNIAASLVRLFAHGITNCELRMMDARQIDRGMGRFDILFHSGLLYHLPDPVEHLQKIREISDCLLLDTHYADGDSYIEKTSITAGGASYPGSVHREYGWSDSLSGVETTSVWLEREALLRLVGTLFESVEVVYDAATPGGKRILVVARAGEAHHGRRG